LIPELSPRREWIKNGQNRQHKVMVGEITNPWRVEKKAKKIKEMIETQI
jgi:hypothetical protein